MKPFVFFLTAFTSFNLISCKKAPELSITIVNFENVDAEKIQYVKSLLKDTFKIGRVEVVLVKLPDETYYKPRNRYRADKLIRYLNDHFDSDKVIGLTDKDISTTSGNRKDWGIMGLASRPGKSCVVSTFRTFRGAKSKELKNERLKKVALHEFGHTFGLPHCENSETCLMRDANGKVATVDEAKYFCSKCRNQIQKFLRNVNNG